MIPANELYGLLAEFERPEDLLAATHLARAAGYRRIDAYTPIPIEGLGEAVGQRPNWLPWLTFVGGAVGAACGYSLQYYACVDSFPLNVGGRPLHSWPAFLPITFELTVLGAALFAVLGMLALNGLPMPYHPLFNVAEFKLATRDRFFLCIESRDEQFEHTTTCSFLQDLTRRPVVEVPK